MDWKDVQYTLWTDSMVAWHWLHKLPSTLKTFVAYRVASIQTNTDIKTWKYVRTKDNPADLLSRGLVASDLVQNEMWLHGPAWLVQQPHLGESEMPVPDISDGGRLEMKVVHVAIRLRDRLCITTSLGRIPLIEYTGKWEKVVSVLAWVLKFIGWFETIKRKREQGNVRQERPIRGRGRQLTTISNQERAKAITELIKEEQEIYYKEEKTHLQKIRMVQEKSKIESLKPILDKEGIMRVGGRLEQSELRYETKHPIIIPNGSRLAWLLVDYAHSRTKHGGVQVMTQFIRERFWIAKIRNELRRYIHKCVICVRHEKRMQDQLMADLPRDRVTCGKPFIATGIDFAGPFKIKMINRNGKEILQQKCWVAVFVCLKTRAIHLDIVSDLSTTAFIACYERFIARRGRCERLYSDNGTTFKGADRELRDAYRKWTEIKAIDHLGARGTEWKLMAPAAPHKGGIYEAAVKSMKHHMVRIIGIRTLTYEQLQT